MSDKETRTQLNHILNGPLNDLKVSLDDLDRFIHRVSKGKDVTEGTMVLKEARRDYLRVCQRIIDILIPEHKSAIPLSQEDVDETCDDFNEIIYGFEILHKDGEVFPKSI